MKQSTVISSIWEDGSVCLPPNNLLVIENIHTCKINHWKKSYVFDGCRRKDSTVMNSWVEYFFEKNSAWFYLIFDVRCCTPEMNCFINYKTPTIYTYMYKNGSSSYAIQYWVKLNYNITLSFQTTSSPLEHQNAGYIYHHVLLPTKRLVGCAINHIETSLAGRWYNKL